MAHAVSQLATGEPVVEAVLAVSVELAVTGSGSGIGSMSGGGNGVHCEQADRNSGAKPASCRRRLSQRLALRKRIRISRSFGRFELVSIAYRFALLVASEPDPVQGFENFPHALGVHL
ncbi:MAG TPA: hypothetical protein VGK73_15730 [Polyangiaceae bacterium]